MKRRKQLDFYETPLQFTKLLLSYIGIHIKESVFECCNGDGAITQELRNNHFTVQTNDIDIKHKADMHFDATESAVWNTLSPSWVISNPPFSSAARIVPLAFQSAKHGIAFLLRLTYLEPCSNRKDFLSLYPPSIIVLPRYSFTKDGGHDSVTCAWFIWRKGPVDRSRGHQHKALVHIATREDVEEFSDEC